MKYWARRTCPMWFISMNHIGTMVFACGKHMICIRNCMDCDRKSSSSSSDLMLSCSHAKLLSRPHALMLSCSCSVALMTPGHQRSSDHDHMMSMEQLHDTALTNQGQTYAKDMTIAVRRALGGLRRDVRCDMRGAKQQKTPKCARALSSMSMASRREAMPT